MSIQVTALVLRRTLGSPTRKAVMLAMADAANDDGAGIWKSAETIAAQAEVSRRTVFNVWSQLEAGGLIVRTGSRRVRGGEVIVWDIDLERLRELPKASAAIKPDAGESSGPTQKPNARIAPGESDDTDPVNLTTQPSAGAAPDSSLNRPIEPSKARAPARGTLAWAVDELWKAAPDTARRRSSRKALTAAIEAALRKRADLTAETLTAAYRRYAASDDAQREGGKFATAVHRWVQQDRFDAFIGEPGLLQAAKCQAPDARSRTADNAPLDFAFQRFAKTGEWHGGRHGFDLRPDSAPPGYYSAELYTRHGLIPPAGREAA